MRSVRVIAAFALLLTGRAASAIQAHPADTADILACRLTVSADVDSSEVFIDGLSAGLTPVTIDSLAAGGHRILVRSGKPASWFSRTDSVFVDLAPGDVRHLHFTAGPPLRLLPAEVPVVSPLLGQADGLEGRTWGILASGGAAVVSGVVAAYFKIAADDRNESYMRTGNPALLDERRRFDTIAGIAFAAMQVGFVVFSYLLLTE